MDLPPGAGDRADEQRGGAGAAARRVVAQIERRDGERVGQPVRRARPERGGHVAFISRNATDEDRFWAENRLVEFCEMLARQK